MQDRSPRGPDADYFLAGEAARFLGVQRRTLYAYASRGLLRSVPAAKGRSRMYARADLVRLKARHDARSGHGPVAATALLFGDPVLATSISNIDERGPLYRGIPAIELASGGARFEDVAEWLWLGARVPSRAGARARADDRAGAPTRDAPHPWRADRGTPDELLTSIAAARPSSGASVLSIMVLALSLSARQKSRAIDAAAAPSTEDAELDRGRRLVFDLTIAAALAWSAERARSAARETTIAAALAAGFGVGARRRRAVERPIDAALVLSADHELNASTFTARVTASTGADLDACTIAALAALSGPKHGGMCDRVESLFDETKGPARARAVVEERIARGEAIPGFGHPLYRDGDPRGRLLVQWAERASGERQEISIATALANAIQKLGGEPPTLDFGLVALRRALGLPRGSATALFAVGRAAGWLAHVFEQRKSSVLLRPRAIFVDGA